MPPAGTWQVVVIALDQDLDPVGTGGPSGAFGRL